MDDPESGTTEKPASTPKRWDWRPKLRWFAAEYLIVVLGVLTAVGVNAWWSERQDRSFERKLRDDIITEFEANLTILESDLATNDSTHALSSSLITLSDSTLLSLSSEELTSQFRDIIDVAGFDPEMGIVQALVESGNVSSVSDPDLRMLLSQWASLLEEKRRFGANMFNFASQNVFRMKAQAASDLIWTEAERRELQTMQRTHSFFHQLVIENQRRLRATALEILDYLEQQK